VRSPREFIQFPRRADSKLMHLCLSLMLSHRIAKAPQELRADSRCITMRVAESRLALREAK
jgi:hypothetical protein